jgi:ComF family protein
MGLLNPLVDLLFPPRCVFCSRRLGDEESPFFTCEVCLSQVLEQDKCCNWCAYPFTVGQDTCAFCREHNFSFIGASAVGLYSGRLKKVVQKYKYGGQKHLAGALGKLMVRQVLSCSWPEMSAVVPVPLHKQRLLERGYDQSLLLAQVIGDELRLPVKQVLGRLRPTPSQTKLGHKDRWHNVQGAFSVPPEYRLSGRMLLVDDLLTTGATAHFAANALLTAGADEVYLAVIGR